MWRMALRTGVIQRHIQRPVQAATQLCHEHDRHYATNDKSVTKAVIFDMGGVLVPSPGKFFKEVEKEVSAPPGMMLLAIRAKGEESAWARFERGEISMTEFGKLFSEECSQQAGKPVDMTWVMPTWKNAGELSFAYPEMIDAIQCIRAEGIKTALLTNNWKFDEEDTLLPVDKALFDVVVESCKVHMRKPDPQIYKHTLELLKVNANEAVFLDDLGMNLKAAQMLGIRTIKVTETKKAVKELGLELGFSLEGYAKGTSVPPKRLEIPLDKLKSYLQSELNLHSEDPPIVRCYDHGQSNPTYFVRYAGKDMVLRKKPPGKLLPSAHAVEREYKVMKAIRDQGVPVPKMLGLCEESSLLGTPFYVMEHIPGRIFKDPLLPGMTSAERGEIYMAMCDVLSRIHKVDIKAAGLEDFGKAGNYVQRNFNRWVKQYEASKTGEIAAMNQLMEWLQENMPQEETLALIHGDFRLDNLIFHPTKPEVLAIIDWELSTLGDPLTDLANNTLGYYFPPGTSAETILPTFSGIDVTDLGIPSVESYVAAYSARSGVNIPNWNFYVAFGFFRGCAIVQGVYKRFTIGQASSPNAEAAGAFAKTLAEIGWGIASGSAFPTSSKSQSPSNQKRHYSTATNNTSSMSSQQYSTSRDRDIPGALPMSVSALSPRAKDLYYKLRSFIQEEIAPLEPEFFSHSMDPKTKWTIHPKLDVLKAKAREQGLWNLFLPKDSDPSCEYGAGLTNLEYAYMAEEMGRHPIASEVFNCSAPDTGNMEVLIRYGTPEQKEQWLKPLLDGKIRSCFGMTEPNVASSDATNIQSSIRREKDHYLINGHKWWTSGANDPRCKICIFMGKTDTSAAVHRQQSMILVPMDAPGVKIVRSLTVFGYDDAPHGHAEVLFENVKVPLGNMLLGEGRGFEIAQGRLGPGRIHHCMRTIGSCERALELMVNRVQERVAFGKPLISYSSIQQDIAKSRIEIEQCRLLTLKAAHMMDTVGNKVAAPEIAMIKVAAPSMAQTIMDRAIQAFGGMGVSQDTPLAPFFVWAKVLRLADGPDEVHMRTIAKMETRSQNLAKL